MDTTIPQAQNDTTQPSGLENTNINPGAESTYPLFKSSEATRQKIIEILANTANGCLSELGYFPGMTLRLHELEDLCAQQEKDLKRAKSEQRRLFEDNVKLNSLAQTQASRLKDMGLTEIEKASRMAKLEEDVQRLTAQKKELVQGRQIQENGGKEVELSFTQLQIKHMDLLESYRLAYTEVQRLHAQIKNQGDELAAVKMQLNTMIVQQNAPNSSHRTTRMTSQPQMSQHTAPPGQVPHQTFHSTNMQMQTHAMQQGQHNRQSQPQPQPQQQQRSTPHSQQPQFHNSQRPTPQPLMIPPSHPQYNQIIAAHLTQQDQLPQQQQQRQPMPQTVSPSQLYFSQQGLTGGQQQPMFYMPQAGSASSPINISPEVQHRQPALQQSANAGLIPAGVQQQMRAMQMQQQQQIQQQQLQQQQQRLFAGSDSRSHQRRASDMSAAPQQMMQPPQHPQPTFYNQTPTSGQIQQMLQDPSPAQNNQKRDSMRRASFPISTSQPSSFALPPVHHFKFIQMGPPSQMPPQEYNSVQPHRTNVSPDAPPWSAPPSVPIYGPSGIPDPLQSRALPQAGTSNSGDPQRQSHSVPTTPTQGFSEPPQSTLSNRMPNVSSRPSSSSSSPQVYLPPPPIDESTIVPASTPNNCASGASAGLEHFRPSSSSSRPGSRQQSVTLSSPHVAQPQSMLPIPLPPIVSHLASNYPLVGDQLISSPPTHEDGSQQQTTPASSTLSAPIPMKRESSTSASDLRELSEERTKRMRVDTESRSPHAETTTGVTPVSPPASSPAESCFVKGEPMDDVPMSSIPFNSEYNGGDVQMGTEDDVIVIEEEEVGPDGLRLVSNCLPDVYDTDTNEDGTSNTCKLCLHRYSRQLLTEPPQPFINATDDELEKHCLDDHESVWMKIRDPS